MAVKTKTTITKADVAKRRASKPGKGTSVDADKAGTKGYINVDLEGSAADLRDDLRELLGAANVPTAQCDCWCSIVDIFPYKYNFIYQRDVYGGDEDGTTFWRQKFTIGADQEPTLDGDPVQVFVDFTESPTEFTDNDDEPATKAVANNQVIGLTEVAQKSLIERAVTAVATRFGLKQNDANNPTPTTPNGAVDGVESGPFVVTKERGPDGRMRFFAGYTNAYKDRHEQIISTAAHKDYVEWATSTRQFPEVWLWHTKGTTIGQVDMLDYFDGVVVASGLVNKEWEELAERLATRKDIGFSHGFIGLLTKEGVWTKYRDYEVTLLPLSAAANPLTLPLELTNAIKESTLGFDPQKREWLLKECKISEDALTSIEKEHEAFAGNLKKLGMETKEAGDGGVPTPAALMLELIEARKAFNALTEKMTTVETTANTATKSATEAVAAAELAVTAAKKNISDAIAEVVAPKAQPVATAAVKASETGAAPPAEGVAAERAQKDQQWFNDLVLAPAYSAVGGAIG